ncbi:MAG: sigma 54-interacting transcriptional regulator, partial [Caldimicrobium sp.]
MILIIFSKIKEKNNLFFCIEELLHIIDSEVYLFDEINEVDFFTDLSEKEKKIVIIDYGSYTEYTESLMKKIKEFIANGEIIIINAPEDINLAVKFLNLGAAYYFTKDLNKECLCNLLNKILGKAEKKFLKEDVILDAFIGKSLAIRKIKEFLPTIAETHCNVLILGETGTGKELLARMIHQLSSRRDGPFVVLDCTLLQETIFESEVFGY